MKKYELVNESTSNMDGDYNFQESIIGEGISLTNYKEEKSEQIEKLVDILNQYPKMVEAMRYAWIALDDGTDTAIQSRKMIEGCIGPVTPGY
jgi:hypothetical protein